MSQSFLIETIPSPSSADSGPKQLPWNHGVPAELPDDERQLLVVGSVERDGATDPVFNPRLEALERQRLVVDGELVDKELGSNDEVRQITDTEDADSAFPRTVALHLRVPLGIDGKKRLRLRMSCQCNKRLR